MVIGEVGKALWVIWENIQSGRRWCCLQPLFGHSRVSGGCRGERGREGGKRDTKTTTYRVVNMSLLCTYLYKVCGFNGDKTVMPSLVCMLSKLYCLHVKSDMAGEN